MSIHAKFDNPEPVALGTTPIVLRFQGLHPNDLGRFSMHDNRSGGDLSHVDLDSTERNETLFGEKDWKDVLKAEVAAAAHQNIRAHVKALKAKSRQKEARKVREKGLVDPWQRSRYGPLREGILTASKAWFGGTGRADWDPEKVSHFREKALTFLRRHFPEGQLRYASGHADEEAYHIHFVVAVWHERITQNRGRQVLLQASRNPLFGNYEHAQDMAGEAFRGLGIIRGRRHAQARRDAKAANEPVPAKRRHVPPSEWRAAQLEEAHMESRQIVAEAEATFADAQLTMQDAQQKAETVVEEGRTLAKVTVRKSRKRAIREARERKVKAAREAQVQIAIAAQHKDALTREAAQLTTAADDAEQEKGAAEVILIRIADKTSMTMERLQVEAVRLQAMKKAHKIAEERVRALNDEGVKKEAARDRIIEEISAVCMKKEKVRQQVQAAASNLMQAQEQTALKEAQAQAAEGWARLAKAQAAAQELALEKVKKKREEEEVKLKAAKVFLREAETRAADIESTVKAVEVGIELIADGALRWNRNAESKSQLIWDMAAPKAMEERRSLLERIRPAVPLLQKIARAVSKAVRAALAVERRQLAEDAAFVAALREDWEADQKAGLDKLSKSPGPS